VSKDKHEEPVQAAESRLGRIVQFWRSHHSEVWGVTKVVGVIVGVVGTMLGIFVDLRETTEMLDLSEQSVAVANVSQAISRVPEDPQAVECGNGVVDEGEECDDGGALGWALCTPSCTNNVAKIAGGSLFMGFRQAELDAGLHLLIPSRKRPEDLLAVAKWATPATPVQYGEFWIMRTEVTWRALIAFLDHSGPRATTIVGEDSREEPLGFPHGRSEASVQWYLDAMARARQHYGPDGDTPRGRPEGPAMASIETAIAYCAWLGGYLPTEGQWEATARGPGGKRTFPWGDRVPKSSPEDCDLLTGFFHVSMDPPVDFNCGGRNTSVPGSLPAGCTPEGVCDLAGNVDEYVLPGAVRWKEVKGSEPGSPPAYIATPPGPQLDKSGQVKFLRVCATIAREDPYGMVSGTLSDCVVGDSFAPRNRWTQTSFPSDQALYVLKGGNFDDSLPVLYQSRARFPWASGEHNKGFRCVVEK